MTSKSAAPFVSLRQAQVPITCMPLSTIKNEKIFRIQWRVRGWSKVCSGCPWHRVYLWPTALRARGKISKILCSFMTPSCNPKAQSFIFCIPAYSLVISSWIMALNTRKCWLLGNPCLQHWPHPWTSDSSIQWPIWQSLCWLPKWTSYSVPSHPFTVLENGSSILVAHSSLPHPHLWVCRREIFLSIRTVEEIGKNISLGLIAESRKYLHARNWQN